MFVCDFFLYQNNYKTTRAGLAWPLSQVVNR